MNIATALTLIVVIAVFSAAIYGSFMSVRNDTNSCAKGMKTQNCSIRRKGPVAVKA